MKGLVISMASDYKNRVVDEILLDKLDAKGGVVIE